MTQEYKISIITPNGKCDIEADSWDDLMFLTPKAVSDVLTSPGQKLSLDATARVVLQAMRENIRRKSSRPSYVAQTARDGQELYLIRCYLRGMLVREAIEWLKKHRGFDCSKSSVGRYWQRLSKIKAAYMFRRQ